MNLKIKLSEKRTNFIENINKDAKLVNTDLIYSKAASKKFKTKKQSRRHENLCFLFSLMRDTEADCDFDDSIDLIEEKDSPFSKVLLFDVHLEAWNDFMGRSGEDQEHFIESLATKECVEKTSAALVETTKSAEDNFNSIDRNIKSLLKREISLGYVEKYESRLVADFLTSDRSKHLVDDVPCSFERMILHGICQYYNLKSRSLESSSQVTVQVNRKDKIPKAGTSCRLADYLKSRFYSSSGLVTCC